MAWLKIACVGALALGAVFAGCSSGPKTPEDISDVGTARLSVLSVGAWENYVDAIQPQFDLTAAQALDAVIPTTATRDERVLDTAGATLKLALPSTAAASSGAAGATESAESGDGGAPPPAAAATATASTSAGNRTAQGLVPLGKLDETPIGMDPMMRYWAATALYEEVQLINRYLRDAAISPNYVPYVIRFEVGLMPKRRHLDYDAYVTLAFFSKRGEADPSQRALPIVMPLLTTDSLEAALHSTTTDRVRTAALELSALVKLVNVSLSADKLREELDRALARDLNSLLMISRLSDNTLRIRLGAIQQGGAEYAMVPQNHFITAVVLVPKDDANSGAGKLDIETFNEMTQSSDGEDVPTKSKQRDRKDVGAITERFQLSLLDSDPVFDEAWNAVLDNSWRDFDKKLRPYIQCGTREEPKRCEKQGDVTSQLQQIWLELARLNTGYGIDTLHIDLPKPPALLLPPKQTVLLLDDKKEMSGTLSGGYGLRKDRLCALLVFDPKKPDQLVTPTRLDVQDGGRQVRLVFPSLKQANLTELAGKNAQIGLSQAEDPAACLDAITKYAAAHADLQHTVRYAQTDALAPDPGFTQKVLSGVLVAKGGKATLRLELSPTDPKGAATVLVGVTGADVTHVSAVYRDDKSRATTPHPAFDGIGADFVVTLKPKQTALVVVELANLKEGTPVKIEGKNEKTQTSAGVKEVPVGVVK